MTIRWIQSLFQYYAISISFVEDWDTLVPCVQRMRSCCASDCYLLLYFDEWNAFQPLLFRSFPAFHRYTSIWVLKLCSIFCEPEAFQNFTKIDFFFFQVTKKTPNSFLVDFFFFFFIKQNSFQPLLIRSLPAFCNCLAFFFFFRSWNFSMKYIPAPVHQMLSCISQLSLYLFFSPNSFLAPI